MFETKPASPEFIEGLKKNPMNGPTVDRCVITKVNKVTNFHPEIESIFVENLKGIGRRLIGGESEFFKFYKILQVLAFRYPEDAELNELFMWAEEIVKVSLRATRS